MPHKKTRIDWDHPVIKFTNAIPDYLACEAFGLEIGYFPKWCKRNGMTPVPIKGRWWIHKEQLEEYFRNGGTSGGSDPAD